MIERLMDMDIYKRDPLTNQYNSKVLTKLIQNYRSHPAIIQISNQMFYDNELIPCAKKGKIAWVIIWLWNLIELVAEITDLCLNWKLLPVSNFPMIFEVAAGEAEQETNCTRLVRYFITDFSLLSNVLSLNFYKLRLMHAHPTK